ncbi:hypothetical protein [Spirochaeta cellobiosiphila]|uniref:hypothetical protein n=1 Tax=Spirochaeta cellobiosiphila TaxID=504483 RepID=UPI000406DEDD|nr:hypothetical protein [Spirochaeta cellobiosiphila]
MSDIDPEIAELIGIENQENQDKAPDFSDLFDEENPQGTEEKDIPDLAKESIKPITRFTEDPKPYFADKNFYKTILTGEGEASKLMHAGLTKYLHTQDKKERSYYRARITNSFWDIAQSIAAKIGSTQPLPKRLFLRYGVLLPTLITDAQRQSIASIIYENNTGEPVHYVDEWLEQVARGRINPLASDEEPISKRTPQSKVTGQLDKTIGHRHSQLAVLKTKLTYIDQQELRMVEALKLIRHHQKHQKYPDLNDTYGAGQRQALNDLHDAIKQVLTTDKEVSRIYHELERLDIELSKLEQQAGELGEGSNVDGSVAINEMISVRQIHKLCGGRQGNHLPLLMKNFFFERGDNYCTRENVLEQMRLVEELDPGLFKRTFRQQTHRIVPHVILVASYGNRGLCWEPFERYNRATSRGRIGIPMFPRDMKIAILSALADLRWQVAKEKAQHYWMEEGLTGWYYQRFEDRKLRGDVRLQFIEDYILWITKESQGTQKLDKEVRAIFWRYMPFPQEVKDNLRNRGFIYNELYKKDMNRLSSDGY